MEEKRSAVLAVGIMKHGNFNANNKKSSPEKGRESNSFRPRMKKKKIEKSKGPIPPFQRRKKKRERVGKQTEDST